MGIINQLKLSKLFLINAALLCVVAVVFRFLFLDSAPGINGDEAAVWARLYDFILGRNVSWQSPTGKSISFLYIATLFPFELMFPTSFFTLRIPGVVFGLVLILLTFVLIKRLFGPTIAVATTLLVMTLPMHLVYSRLYIEQSLMGITVLVTLYYALQGKSVKTLLWYAIALLIHPVNVFCTPLLACAYFYYLYFESDFSPLKKKIYTGIVIGASVVGVVAIMNYVPKEAFINTFANLKQAAQFPSFVFLFVRIFSGVTPIEDVAGALPRLVVGALDVFFWGLMLGGFVFGIKALREKRDLRALTLLMGWFISLVVFYVVGGFIGVKPGLQRHALFLMVPTVLVLALLWNAILEQKRTAFVWSSSAIAWGFLILFGQFFLMQYYSTGGRSHILYQSAKVEPKQKAHEWILETSKGEKYPVVSEDWWLYQPIRYLSKKEMNLRHLMVFRHDSYVPLESVQKIIEKGGYVVGWTEGRMDQMVKQKYKPEDYQEKTFYNGSNEALLKVWHFPKKG